MNKRGVNRDNQKKSNRGLVLQLVATRECTSRIDLSRRMGLTKTAISQIVGGLLEEGVLAETEKESDSGLGRNPMGINISPDAPLFAGILIQRGFCEAVICDMQLGIKSTEKLVREWKNEDELLSSVYYLLDHLLANEPRVIGIGAASIGPVSVREGRIIDPLFFSGISDIALRSLLEERYHLPVFFDHDNQSAVKAEYLYGNARGFQDVLLVSLSRGVGCGILIGGSRLHSETGYAPEIGHISIDYKGKVCPCGNVGCLEMYVNSGEVLDRMRKATGLGLTYADFVTRPMPEVEAIMNDILEKLADGIISVLNILNSQIVLLAMDCDLWPDRYITQLEEEINRRKFGNRDTVIHVKKTFFRDKCHVLGAACNAISEVFAGGLLS